MNFLAHLHLADATPASWVGNLLPDFVRGRLPAELHPQVAAGVRRHRAVDAFTDTHPVVARSKARLRAAHGRFSGILVDVFYDHFLARDWAHHHPQPLETFTRQVHRGFAAHPELMPEPMRRATERMREQNWLCCYAEVDGIELTLRRMSLRFSERLRRTVCLERAMADLHRHEQGLAADFADFFPELVDWVAERGASAGACTASAHAHAHATEHAFAASHR